jgi:hypothetical protein
VHICTYVHVYRMSPGYLFRTALRLILAGHDQLELRHRATPEAAGPGHLRI